ncbi:hypothetical protein SY83_14160 [Paenibacillus swuensis]|uniref:Penicillin-binding protein n=1 Tax=Paenibacillus swuensis TaxID=1178515 RepID=A0A172TJM7_9BACL|nr:penicillin-binding protein 2 [Paenibacillus swuensis]ANE47220.1 hypothetical protein SY83_14160 [Paenibacillus swuensis]
MKRRMFVLLASVSLILIIIGGRLMWIQVITAHHFTSRNIDLVSESVRQREKGIVLNSGRGIIKDRNGIPFTSEWQRVLVVTPVAKHYQGSAEQIAKLSHALGTTEDYWHKAFGEVKEPQFWRKPGDKQPTALTADQEKTISSLKVPNLKVMPYVRRYPEGMNGSHAIGFVSQHPEHLLALYAEQIHGGLLSKDAQVGASGLEKAFEPYLRGVGASSVSFYTDAKKQPLQGLHMRLVRPTSAYYPLNLITSLDAKLQGRIEAYLEREGLSKGAVVVMDVVTGEVLTSASRPVYDPYTIVQQDKGWANAAVKAVTPGSIFKTVIASAALEEGVVDKHERFECSGELGKYGLSCWKHGGHGRLTFKEAFAQSCNVVFAKVAARLSANTIERYAHKLGLSGNIGWSGASVLDGSALRMFEGEEAGQLFAKGTPRTDGGVLAQTAIGQRDVLLSPLQAASMAAAVARGGEVRSPQLVNRVEYANGDTMAVFGGREVRLAGEAPISEATAATLRGWMRGVVTEGTGASLRDAKWALAGKSGTAQVVSGGVRRVNQWFIGYGPADKPRFAVSVLVKDASPEASHQATRLFKGVMDILADY